MSLKVDMFPLFALFQQKIVILLRAMIHVKQALFTHFALPLNEIFPCSDCRVSIEGSQLQLFQKMYTHIVVFPMLTVKKCQQRLYIVSESRHVSADGSVGVFQQMMVINGNMCGTFEWFCSRQNSQLLMTLNL